MIKKIILLSAILLTLNSCKQNETNLSQYPLIKETFNKSEIVDLEKILTFFDYQIHQEFKTKSIKDDYSFFYKKSLKDLENGIMYIGFSLRQQDSLFREINQKTISEIWNKGKSFKETDTVNIIYLKTDSKYIEFLKSLGKKNNYIKSYTDDLTNFLDITPHQSYFFTNNYDSLNFNDDRVRLIIAIHYLTLNDTYR